jgi:hypothetical protein
LSHNDAVPAIAVAMEVESLLVVRDATDRYCKTSSATGYMKAACTRFDFSLGRLSRVLEQPVKPETVFVAPGVPPGACMPEESGCNPGSRGNVGYTVQLYYNSQTMYEPPSGVDTVTICAVLESQSGAQSLAWPPVRIKTLGDSSVFGPRGGNPATQMCARALAMSGLADTTKVAVTWMSEWVTVAGRRLWRPFPAVP